MIHDQNLKAHVFALIQRKEKGEKKHVKLNYDMGYQNISRSFFSELKKKNLGQNTQNAIIIIIQN